MDFRGIFDHGVVRPTEPVSLPDGTEVECRPVEIDSTPFDGDEFWTVRTIDDLTEAQAVEPVTRVGDLLGDWPAEDDIDSFMDEVRKGRR